MTNKIQTTNSSELIQNDLFEHCQSLFRELACEQKNFELNSYQHFARIKLQIDTHRQKLKDQIDSSTTDMKNKTKESKEFFQQKIKEIQQMPDIDESKNVTIEESIQLLHSKVNDASLISSQVRKCTFEAKNDVSQSSFGILSSLYLNRYLESIFPDRSIKIWDLVYKKWVRNCVGFPKHISYVNYQSNSHIIGIFYEKHLKVWHKEGKWVKTLLGHRQRISSLTVFPDKNQVVTGSFKEIKVWDIQKGKRINTFSQYIDGWVKCIYAISDDWIVHCSESNIIQLWKITLDYKFNLLIGHTAPINCFLLLKNVRLASGSDDKSIKIWNLATLECILTLRGHTDSVISFTSTEKCELISSSRDKTIKIWNSTSGQCLKTLCEDAIWIGSLLNEFLVSASRDNIVKTWNLESGTCMLTFSVLQS